MQKTYVVVGASSGIGYQITKKLIAAGNEVISISRSKPDLPVKHHTFNVVQDDTSTLPLLENISGLVYAPGSINLKPFRGLKVQDFENELNINLMSAIKILQWAQKPLVADGASSVVLFSTVAVQQGMPFHTSVAAAKGAVEGLTRSLAAEWAPKVRVNAIAPSLTQTPLAERLLNNEAKQEAAAKRHPLQRFGQAEDIANAAIFLLSEQSSWITGQILGVDGGMAALKL